MRTRRLLRRSRAADGYTITELVAVMAILTTIVTALTSLFVSGAQAELDLNRRVEAQQAARLAVEKLRRELHCASGITPEGSAVASITVTLPGHCPTAVGGAETQVVYETVSVATERYQLERAGVVIADYITEGAIFHYHPQSTEELGRLHVDVPVNAYPDEGWKEWRLVDDIVLRNTTRS